MRIGLRTWRESSPIVWERKRIKLDRTPPLLAVTNPVAGTISRPMSQLQGYCSETVNKISYALTNATGLLTNQYIVVLDRHYDTNTWEFTTSTFQAFDVSLTNGFNTLIISARDLAGNVTVTNYDLELVNDSGPPVVNLTWPQDGIKVSGSTFTIKGTVDDPTASVTLDMLDTNGTAISFTGLVERDGKFWVENVPLFTETNLLTLTAMDAWGNSTVTNWSVVQSSVALTINPIDPAHLHHPTVSLSGTVSDPSHAVWVNGVSAVVSGSGAWAATNVPVTPGGTASFEATAYPSGEAPSGGAAPNSASNPPTPNSSHKTTDPDKPMRVYAAKDTHEMLRDIDYGASGFGTFRCTYQRTWIDGAGGSGSQIASWSYPDYPWTNHIEFAASWPATEWPELRSGSVTCTGDCGLDYLHSFAPWPAIRLEHCNVVDTQYLFTWEDTQTRIADTQMKLYTGGKSISGQQSLFVIGASASEIFNKRDDWVEPDPWQPYNGPGPQPITATNITVGPFGKLGADGACYAMLADNATVDITPEALGYDFYRFDVSATKHAPYITANGTNLATSTPEFCVGQQVANELIFDPPLSAPVQYKWIHDGDYVNTIIPPVDANHSPTYTVRFDLKTNNITKLWWIDGGQKFVWCEVTVGTGVQALTYSTHGFVNIYRPTLGAFSNAAPRSFLWLTDYLPDRLSYGNVDGGTNGMLWTTKIDSKYDGRWGVTQKFKARYHQIPMAWDKLNTLSSDAVDNAEFYDGTHMYRTNTLTTQFAILCH